MNTETEEKRAENNKWMLQINGNSKIRTEKNKRM